MALELEKKERMLQGRIRPQQNAGLEEEARRRREEARKNLFSVSFFFFFYTSLQFFLYFSSVFFFKNTCFSLSLIGGRFNGGRYWIGWYR